MEYVEYKINNPPDFDPHVTCYSYPNCDLVPNGCREFTRNPESYGHRD